MPRTTHEYPFEQHVAWGVGARVKSQCELTDDAASYLLVFKNDGSLSVCVYPPNTSPAQDFEAAKTSGKSFVFLDPIDDGMEYIYFEWSAIDRSTMERLIGRTFVAEDFVSRKAGDVIDYPETWRVMF